MTFSPRFDSDSSSTLALIFKVERCPAAGNSSLIDWLLDEYIGGANGLGSPNVDFIFLDDEWDATSGPSEVGHPLSGSADHDRARTSEGSCRQVGPDAVTRMGLSPSDVKELTVAYWKNMEAMQKGIVARGGFEWHSFVGAG